MQNSTATDSPASTSGVRAAGLEMRWLPVTDDAGRTRMVTSWIDPSLVSTTATHHAA